MTPIYTKIEIVYGKPVVYPICDVGRAACALAGTKTITDSMLAPLRAMGFKVYEAPREAKEIGGKQ